MLFRGAKPTPQGEEALMPLLKAKCDSRILKSWTFTTRLLKWTKSKPAKETNNKPTDLQRELAMSPTLGPGENGKEPPITFFDLPPEIRNQIYDLSGCLKALQCRGCQRNVTGDNKQQMFAPDSDLCFACFKYWKRWHERFNRPFEQSSPGFDVEHGFVCINRGSKWLQASSFYGRSIYDRKSTSVRVEGIMRYGRYSLREPINRNDYVGVAQPALTKVCQQMRKETLPMWYGNKCFFHTLFWMESMAPKWDKWRKAWKPFHKLSDAGSLLRWLEVIGPENAGMIRSLKVVYTKHVTRADFETWVLPRLKKLGLRTDDGVLVMAHTPDTRMELVYGSKKWKIGEPCPGCECCIMGALKKG